jgi:hypothetical protein
LSAFFLKPAVTVLLSLLKSAFVVGVEPKPRSGPDVPASEFIVHEIAATPEQMAEAQKYRFQISAGLLGEQRMAMKERLKLSQIAKGFIYRPLDKSGTSSRIIEGFHNEGKTCTVFPEFVVVEQDTRAQDVETFNLQPNDFPIREEQDNIGRFVGSHRERVYKIHSHKPKRVADIAQDEFLRGNQTLIWTCLMKKA